METRETLRAKLHILVDSIEDEEILKAVYVILASHMENDGTPKKQIGFSESQMERLSEWFPMEELKEMNARWRDE